MAILGIAILIVFFTLPAKEISGFEELEKLNINDKVSFNGVVEKVRDFGDFKIIKIKGIDVVCDCKDDFTGKEIEIIGKVEEYNGKKQVRALRIQVFE